MTPSAWTNRIQVERFINRQFQGVLDIVSVDNELPRFDIIDGDIVKVFPILMKDKNAVYLGGNVLRPGKYEFRAGMRITDIIQNYQDLLPETYFNYAAILRQNPETGLYQIFPFNLRRALDNPSSDESNLALEPKDEVVVYNQDYFEPDRTVSIDGAVTRPGTFKLLENMRVRDLILKSGGLRLEASRKRGELYRRNVEGKQAVTQIIEFCVECAMTNDSANNHLLLRSDRVYIRQKQGWEEERKITLSGRFVYPGTYIILEGETLSGLIKRAGGYKEDAYLTASVFTRKSVKELEFKRRNEYLQQLDVNMLNLSSELALNDKNQEAKELRSQLAALRSKLGEINPTGRVIIDLTKPEQCDNFAIEDGDAIYVPRNMNTISVIGDVYNPSTLTFNKDRLSPWYYLESSGGLRETADKKHIYVVKANGLIITNSMKRISSITLEAGDAVVVPQKIRLTSTGKIFLDTIDTIFKIATTATTIIALIFALNN
jgi:polysaccharide biosynthesis/export protein